MTDPRPYHLLSYGTLLGVQVYQSFVAGIVSFRALPRPQFATLQTAIFPIYFGLQTALPVVIALTAAEGRQSTNFPGILASEGASKTMLPIALTTDNATKVLLPLGTVAVTGLINLLVLRPATTKVMRERKHQETRDGKRSYDPPPHSKEMMALNKKFGRLHGLSSLLNMVSLAATVYYGVVLSKRLS